MSIVPPSATLIWALPTKFEDIQCFVWEGDRADWVIAIVFGSETFATYTAPTLAGMEAIVEILWRGMLKSGAPHTPAAYPEPPSPRHPFPNGPGGS